jgi:hypothetical protein
MQVLLHYLEVGKFGASFHICRLENFGLSLLNVLEHFCVDRNSWCSLSEVHESLACRFPPNIDVEIAANRELDKWRDHFPIVVLDLNILQLDMPLPNKFILPFVFLVKSFLRFL